MIYTARDGSPLPLLRGVIHCMLADGTVVATHEIPGDLRDFLTNPLHLNLAEGPVDERLEGVVNDEVHYLVHNLKKETGEPAQVYGAFARRLGLPSWETLQGSWAVELLASEPVEAEPAIGPGLDEEVAVPEEESMVEFDDGNDLNDAFGEGEEVER